MIDLRREHRTAGEAKRGRRSCPNGERCLKACQGGPIDESKEETVFRRAMWAWQSGFMTVDSESESYPGDRALPVKRSREKFNDQW